MAAKCGKEKKALDEATNASTSDEREWGYWEAKADEWEATAQRTLDSIVDCIDEDCFYTRFWLLQKQLDWARGLRNTAEKYHSDFMLRHEIQELRKDAYCECLNRQRPR